MAIILGYKTKDSPYLVIQIVNIQNHEKEGHFYEKYRIKEDERTRGEIREKIKEEIGIYF